MLKKIVILIMALSILMVLVSCKGINAPDNSDTLIETSGSEPDMQSVNKTGSEEATNNINSSNSETTVIAETTQNTGSITKNQLLDLFKLKKDEVIKKLGDKYDIVFAGAEGSYEGYDYKELGIIVCFDSDDTIAFIDCDEKVSIDGARTGMSFAQIQEKLGTSEVKETWIETPENKTYEIAYIMDNCVISFISTDKDGIDCGLSIYKSNKQ